MELPVSDKLKEIVGECLTAFARDTGLQTLGIEQDAIGGIEGLSTILGNSYPCPCSRSQALGDSGRFQQQKDLTQCFVSTVPMSIPLFLSVLSLTQQCCFDPNTG